MLKKKPNAEKKAREKLDKLINNKGSKSVDFFHKKLGKIMWNKCGMARNKKDLELAISEISRSKFLVIKMSLMKN